MWHPADCSRTRPVSAGCAVPCTVLTPGHNENSEIPGKGSHPCRDCHAATGQRDGTSLPPGTSRGRQHAVGSAVPKQPKSPRLLAEVLHPPAVLLGCYMTHINYGHHCFVSRYAFYQVLQVQGTVSLKLKQPRAQLDQACSAEGEPEQAQNPSACLLRGIRPWRQAVPAASTHGLGCPWWHGPRRREQRRAG